MIERYRRSPDEIEQTSGAADEFLAFACLRFGGDDDPRGRLDIPLEQQWFTPLHAAAQTGDVEMTRLLLRLGADPSIRSEWGATPLESARQHGREEVAELLEP